MAWLMKFLFSYLSRESESIFPFFEMVVSFPVAAEITRVLTLSPEAEGMLIEREGREPVFVDVKEKKEGPEEEEEAEDEDEDDDEDEEEDEEEDVERKDKDCGKENVVAKSFNEGSVTGERGSRSDDKDKDEEEDDDDDDDDDDKEGFENERIDVFKEVLDVLANGVSS